MKALESFTMKNFQHCQFKKKLSVTGFYFKSFLVLLLKRTQKQLLAGHESFAAWLFLQVSCDKALHSDTDYISRCQLFVQLLWD